MVETWYQLARENRKAASALTTAGLNRSAVSRAYYACYALAAFELYTVGVSMPSNREGPSHGKLRPLIIRNYSRLKHNERLALADLIGRLYALRLFADYQPSTAVDSREAREAVSIMNDIFNSF